FCEQKFFSEELKCDLYEIGEKLSSKFCGSMNVIFTPALQYNYKQNTYLYHYDKLSQQTLPW
ncbi:MAG: hypothetical protein ABI416_16015, partial [Ginsengibacter sp.]